MRLLDLTLDTPAENLALEEVLLEQAEADAGPSEVLRLWESPVMAVVLGRSSNADIEVRRDACRTAGIPWLRRASGGATVMIGPGCLMYAVLLPYDRHPNLAMIEVAHEFVLARLRAALSQFLTGVEFQGTSDLTWHGRKFSGNSLRCKRRHLLYHGTVLYDFPLDYVERCLGTPPRQPDYRLRRSHADFIVNLPIDPVALRRELARQWGADEPFPDWPRELTRRLAAERYESAAWTERH